MGTGSIAGLKQAAKKFAQAVAKMGVNAFLLIVSMVQFGTATVKGVKVWLSKKTSAKENAGVNSGTQRSRTVIDNGLNAKKWAGKKVEELPETAVKGSKTNIDTVVRIESFTPPGSSKPIEIYTDGFSRVPKGKIDIYARGHVKKPVNYDIRKEIIKQFEKMQNENPEKITKQMQRENAT
ncbi:hypothetical protein [Treponema zioleckii]|uniref:hypothetical protein n=1 Tax=Treponema zioleckii TaxID=331680 RepID=UPI00168A46AC|nr:hypothetical protein [Treponema zioleckii]